MAIQHIQESYDGTISVISVHHIEIQHPSQYDSIIEQYKKHIKDKNATNIIHPKPEE